MGSGYGPASVKVSLSGLGGGDSSGLSVIALPVKRVDNQCRCLSWAAALPATTGHLLLLSRKVAYGASHREQKDAGRGPAVKAYLTLVLLSSNREAVPHDKYRAKIYDTYRAK